MGVSVEDNRVLHRIDDLREVPAAVRFLSCEPLIGSLADINLRGIHWVIVGGESGPHARPMNVQWVCESFERVANKKCRSSSSNGAACEKISQGDRSAAEPMMRCPTNGGVGKSFPDFLPS